MKICLIDFDKTLINVDSCRYIFKKDKLYLKIPIYTIIYLLNLTLPKRYQVKYRLIFKKKLYQFIDDKYIDYFKSQINHTLIDIIKGKRYDYIVIISSTKLDIIQHTLKDVFEVDCILSNCWNIRKVEKLQRKFPYWNRHTFHLFTDSYDDKPLMKICKETYIV